MGLGAVSLVRRDWKSYANLHVAEFDNSNHWRVRQRRGLEGVYFGLALRWAMPWPDVFPLAHPIPPAQLVLYALVGIGFDIYSVATETAAGIAYGAHIGGFASGLLFALLLTSVYGSMESWNPKRA